MPYISKMSAKGVSHNIVGIPRSIKVTTLAGLPCSGNEHIEATLSGATEFSVGAGMQPGDRTVVTCIPNSSFTQRINGRDYQIKNKRKFKIYILCISPGVYSTVVIESLLGAVYEYTPISTTLVQPGDLYFTDGFDKPENAGKHNPDDLIGIVTEASYSFNYQSPAEFSPEWKNGSHILYILDLRALSEFGGGGLISRALSNNSTIPTHGSHYLPWNMEHKFFPNYFNPSSEESATYAYTNNISVGLSNEITSPVYDVLHPLNEPSVDMINLYKQNFDEEILSTNLAPQYNYLPMIHTLKNMNMPDVKSKILNTWDNIKTSYSNTASYLSQLIKKDVMSIIYNSEFLSSTIGPSYGKTTTSDTPFSTVCVYDMKSTPAMDNINDVKEVAVNALGNILPFRCVYVKMSKDLMTKLMGQKYNYTINVTPKSAVMIVDGITQNNTGDGVYNLTKTPYNVVNYTARIGSTVIAKNGSFLLDTNNKVINIEMEGDYSMPGGILDYISASNIQVGDVMMKGGGIVPASSLLTIESLTPEDGISKIYSSLAFSLNLKEPESPFEAICVDRYNYGGKTYASFINVDEFLYDALAPNNPSKYMKLSGDPSGVYTVSSTDDAKIVDAEVLMCTIKTDNITGGDSFPYKGMWEEMFIKNTSQHPDDYLYHIQNYRQQKYSVSSRICEPVRQIYKSKGLKMINVTPSTYYQLPTPDVAMRGLGSLIGANQLNPMLSRMKDVIINMSRTAQADPGLSMNNAMEKVYWVNVPYRSAQTPVGEYSENYGYYPKVTTQQFYYSMSYNTFTTGRIFLPEFVVEII